MWLAFLLPFLLSLIPFLPLPPVTSGIASPLHAYETADKRPPGSSKSKGKRPTSRHVRPVTVNDIRVQTSPESTRLVLDLERSVTFRQTHHTHPDRLVVDLPNTQLSDAARHAIARVTFPDDIAISQTSPPAKARAVRVSINLGDGKGYHVTRLSNPPRLVVDLVSPASPSTELNTAPASSGSSSSSLANVTKPQGTAPSPKPPARQARDDVKLIVVDPGHGGKDSGAVGAGGMEEKTITLRVGLRVRDLLAERLKKQVIMTRERDVFIELDDRAKFANSREADLFVSIHVNAHPQHSVKGLEVYHFGEATDRRALEVAARENGTPIEETGVGWQYLVADLLTTKKVQESLDLAWNTKHAILDRLRGDYAVEDHGVKTAPFYVLRYTSMPSILAEIAFISNSDEERLMQTEAYLAQIAEGIYEGIKSYLSPPTVTAR